MMSDPAFEEARQAMERGDLDGAADAFRRVLASSPGHPVASMGLAQVDLIRRVSSRDEQEARRAAAENPADVDAQARVADIEVAAGRPDVGFDRMLGTIRRTAGEDRDRARVHLVGLFEGVPAGGLAGRQGARRPVQPAVLTCQAGQRPGGLAARLSAGHSRAVPARGAPRPAPRSAPG